MQSLFSLLFIITPALIFMLLIVWIREQHWFVKLCSVLVFCFIGFESMSYYFPEKSLSERYTQEILHKLST